MADINTSQAIPASIAITNAAGAPAQVDGAPVWASSDATVLSVVAAADGLSALISSVAPGTARVTVSADADLGAGVIAIAGVSEDINVTVDPANLASVITLTLGPAQPK